MPTSKRQKDKFYVYILYSKKDGRLYTGYSPELKTRIQKHKNGYVNATKYRRPVELVYCEAYMSKADANLKLMLKREKFI